MGVLHTFEGIGYEEGPLVYPVREDTLLLYRSLKPMLIKTRGIFLEMGCGTGLLSLIAAKMGWDVISVDREPRALLLLRKNMERNNCSFEPYLSDLYQGVPRSLKGIVDLVVFNPPYLEGDGRIENRRRELALMGGVGGMETAERFLGDSGMFLGNGSFLFLLSRSDWASSRILNPQGLVPTENPPFESELDGERFRVLCFQRKG